MQRLPSPAGATVSYDQYGSGPPLILVHGGFSDHKETSVGLPALAGRGKELTSEGSMPDGVTIIDKLGSPIEGSSSFKGRLPPLGGSPVT
jgi:hypothetical protein